jgi:hypothetical protein
MDRAFDLLARRAAHDLRTLNETNRAQTHRVEREAVFAFILRRFIVTREHERRTHRSRADQAHDVYETFADLLSSNERNRASSISCVCAEYVEPTLKTGKLSSNDDRSEKTQACDNR